METTFTLRNTVSLGVLLLAAVACDTTPLPVAVRDPGTVSSIAIEPSERALWVKHAERNPAGTTRAHLAAIDPITHIVTDVLDVSELTGLRVSFPRAERMLVMGHLPSGEAIALVDTVRHQVLAKQTSPTRFFASLVSPSGNHSLVCESIYPLPNPGCPLRLLDNTTLESSALGHGGNDGLVARWRQTQDQVLGVAVDTSQGSATAHLTIWPITQRQLGAPIREITIPNHRFAYKPSAANIVLSPDDRWAALALLDHATGNPDAVLVDLETGALRTFPGQGLMTFSPDGTTFELYSGLYLFEAPLVRNFRTDLHSMATTEDDDRAWLMPIIVSSMTGLATEIAYPDGVATARFYDPNAGDATLLDDDSEGRLRFTARVAADELWSVQYGRLASWSATPEKKQFELPFEATAINRIASQDLLVLAVKQRAELALFAPEARAVIDSITFPSPFDALGLPRLAP